jgi:hypothetical protein
MTRAIVVCRPGSPASFLSFPLGVRRIIRLLAPRRAMLCRLVPRRRVLGRLPARGSFAGAALIAEGRLIVRLHVARWGRVVVEGVSGEGRLLRFDVIGDRLVVPPRSSGCDPADGPGNREAQE